MKARCRSFNVKIQGKVYKVKAFDGRSMSIGNVEHGRSQKFSSVEEAEAFMFDDITVILKEVV